jgi:hypothetical protein
MTLDEQVKYLAEEYYPNIDMETLRILPTCSKIVKVTLEIEETIMMDQLDAVGNPMMGWGAKTNTLVIHQDLIDALKGSAGIEFITA